MDKPAKKANTLYRRIWRSIAAVVALVFLLGGTAVTIYVDRSITAQIEDKERAFLSGVDSTLAYQLSSGQQLLDMLLSNPFIIQSIYSDNTRWNSSVYQSGQTIVNAVSSNQVYNSIYVIAGDRIAIKSSRRYQTAEDEDMLIESMQQDFRRKLTPWRSTINSRANRNLMLLSALDTVLTPNTVGGVLINLDLDRLAERAFAGRGSSEVYMALDGQIVASSDPDAFFTDVADNALLTKAAAGESELHDGYYVFSYTNPTYGYTLYAVQQRAALMTPVKTGLAFLLAIISAFLAVTLLISRRAAQHAYTPVKTILIQLEEQLPGHEAGAEGLSDLQRVSRTIRRTSEIVSAYRHDNETARLGRFIHNGAADHRVPEMLERHLGYDGRHPLYMLLFQAQDATDARTAADILQGLLDGYARFLTLDMPERRLLSLVSVTSPAGSDEDILADGIEQVLRLLREQGAGKVIMARQGALSGVEMFPDAYTQMVERMRSGVFCAGSTLLAAPVSGAIPEELIQRAQAAVLARDGEDYLRAVTACLACCPAMVSREAYHQLATLCARIEETGTSRNAGISERLDSYRTCLNTLFTLRDYDAIVAHMTGLYQTAVERIDARQSGAGNALAERITGYMALHFGDANLSAAQVADALGISVSHLSRVMNKSIGCGFPELLQKMRLECAANLLLTQPDLPIAQLAQQCGFGSASYFTASFKRIYGVTPSNYRLQHSGEHKPS